MVVDIRCRFGSDSACRNGQAWKAGYYEKKHKKLLKTAETRH